MTGEREANKLTELSSLVQFHIEILSLALFRARTPTYPPSLHSSALLPHTPRGPSLSHSLSTPSPMVFLVSRVFVSLTYTKTRRPTVSDVSVYACDCLLSSVPFLVSHPPGDQLF
ncbi:Hypothetical protein NTJ_06555 [Nesidiocoris tenuis]|uniref:Uncharacterized protein n=1 Tax=Nesidiocoris tenuis TaxID=355587 RepID=A0ABN7ANE6_9HEMI|nr:Hypothetical protein NTJ_06555 [Nesidiocoris tenuis]